MWYGCKKQQENKSIVAVVQVVGGITITRQLHIVCNTFRFCSSYRAVCKFDSILSRNYLFNHLKWDVFSFSNVGPDNTTSNYKYINVYIICIHVHCI